MTELIKLTGDKTPVVDSLTIAEGVNVQHKNIIELIRKYSDDFEQFGRVTFETRTLQTTGGKQKQVVALLNEDHAMLLFTFLKNTEIARKFKVRLILAFKDCRIALREAMAVQGLPKTLSEALRLAADLEEKRQSLAAANLQLTHQIEQDKPKVDAAERFLNSSGSFIIRVVAKALGVGVMFLYDYMRNIKMISQKNEPYATFCSSGYLRPIPGYYEGPGGEEKCRMTTHVTPSGVFYLFERLKKDGHIPAMRQIDLSIFKGNAA